VQTPEQPVRRPRSWAPLALALWMAVLVTFLFLAIMAVFFDRFPSDEYIAHRIQDIDAPGFAGYMDFVNVLGVAWLFVPLTAAIAALLLARNNWVEATLVLLTFFPRWINSIAKDAIDRPRPSPELVHATGDLSSAAFPSGHTAGTAVLFALLFLVMPLLVPWRPLRWLLQAACLLFVVSAGPARIYVGAHWPSDTLGGYLLALLFVIPALAVFATLGSKGNPR
jgi:undecaprenyl-diphosphatase